MEPSVFDVISVETVIKFRKADLEALKDSKDGCLTSSLFPICQISNLQYFISIHPNEFHAGYRKTAWIFLHLSRETGIERSVEADVVYSVESANFSRNVQHVYKKCEGYGKQICDTDELFDPQKNFFIDDVLIVKVKGVFKILLPSGIKYPLFALWKIKESDLNVLKTSTNCFLQSKRFNISSDSELKYYLKFYPNGNNEENRGNAWIFLYLIRETRTPVTVVLKFSIDSASHLSDLRCQYSSKGESWGNLCCATEELFNPYSSFFVEGELILKVTGTLMIEKENSENTVLTCEKGIATKSCRKYRAKNFTVVVGGKNIEMHEHVLSKASPIFAEMIRTKEKSERKIEIPDFNYDIVRAAILLMYSFSVDQQFSFEQIKSLLHFSVKYDIKLIKNIVQDYLIQRLSPTNVCHLINFSTTTGDANKLLLKCTQYLIKCMKESKAVHGLETVDKEVIHQCFLTSFTQNLETDSETENV